MEFEKLEIGCDLKKETKIYRYMTLEQFMCLVEKNKIYLTRLTSWDDTWEVPRRMLPSKSDNGGLEYPLNSDSTDYFGQCWTLKEESDAMWRIYSSGKNGVKIRTSIKKLELIKGLLHSSINKVFYYRNLIDGLEVKNETGKMYHLVADGLIKRDAFEHEEEVRLITLNDKRLIGDKVTKGNYIEFSVDAKEFIEEIVVDPRAKEYYFNTIQSYCERVGFKIKPIKSDLYGDNLFEKTRIVQEWRKVE